MTKENLISLAGSILDMVDSSANLDGVEDYGGLQHIIASMISDEFNLGIEFTDDECEI